MQTVEFAKWLREKVDWSRYVSLVKHVDKDLNARKLRFDKSDLFERSLEVFSNRELIYVDYEGVDHWGPDGITVEMKYTDGALFTRVRKDKKEYVSDLQLMNTRGSSAGRTLPDTYAQFLLICDRDAVAVIAKEDLLPYVVDAGDGLKTSKLPSDLVQYVFTPGEFVAQDIAESVSYKQAKLDMQTDYLQKF